MELCEFLPTPHRALLSPRLSPKPIRERCCFVQLLQSRPLSTPSGWRWF